MLAVGDTHYTMETNVSSGGHTHYMIETNVSSGGRTLHDGDKW